MKVHFITMFVKKAQVKSLPFKKRIVQHDTPSDTDSDSVEPPTIQLRSPPPTPTANTVVVKTPRPVGRPPKNANGPKSTPQPTGRPRGRPRLSESSSGAKNTPKLPKKRNLSEQELDLEIRVIFLFNLTVYNWTTLEVDNMFYLT